MLDLDTATFQATTLSIRQLRLRVIYHRALALVTIPPTSTHHTALADIYKTELTRRIDYMKMVYALYASQMLIIRADETLYWYFPPITESLKATIMDQLWAGERITWPDLTEQWREFEPRIVDGHLVWNDDHTQFLVDVVLYTFTPPDTTTSKIIGSFWRTPA